MLNDILTGIAVGVGIALITILGRKFTEVVILKRDLATQWKKYEMLEKQLSKLDQSLDELKIKVALLERDQKS